MMMHSNQLIPAFAVVVTLAAAVTDVRSRRIPNRLTYPAMLAGLALQAVSHGWRGLLLAASAGLFWGVVFLLFYLVQAMGAGDVKLATALGCISGFADAQRLMLATAVAGGLLAVIFMVRSRRVAQTLRSTVSVMAFHVQHGLKPHPEINLHNPKTVRMPYGLAFMSGTLYWVVSSQLWR
jgi:prepilin peptidase CpaA